MRESDNNLDQYPAMHGDDDYAFQVASKHPTLIATIPSKSQEVRMSWSSRIESHGQWPRKAWSGILALCTLAASAAASACVGDSPVEVARWVSKNRPQLAAPDSSRFITADFLASIRRDTAQATAQDEICGICGGDLWTNSQEGYARPPKSFRQSLRSGSRAEVIYSMRFSIEDTGPSERRSARIVLLKEQGCWKIDDIVHGDASIKRIVGGSK